ncbi:DUF7857 domain-containing protein [Haladaptatus caseinilyticus]|uniref:DUF7857 domain-containing protein n=1 Tax=Haladaptatus caseinilyticus TaxID=2993314 RepID=UPI00224B37A7|nr:hypothetical protein [Haladaptatus caseinilyticus]
MVTLRWTTDEHSHGHKTVTLVELVIENSSEIPIRLRIANQLDGAVWPPRVEGVPEVGWDDGGYEGVVDAGERRALGYASPAKQLGPDTVPVEIVWTERAAKPQKPAQSGDVGLDAGDGSLSIRPTTDGVIRSLGDSRPPSDAVPLPVAFELPENVESWLVEVESRIERHDIRDTDRRALRAAADQASDLLERAETAHEATKTSGGNT